RADKPAGLLRVVCRRSDDYPVRWGEALLIVQIRRDEGAVHQVLFRPFGIPIYGFGMMLFVAFVVCTWLAGRRADKEGIAKEHLQDLAIWLFAGGIIGARLTFLIAEGLPLWEFFRIWDGGLILYGSFAGGTLGYFGAYYFVLRKHGVSTWKLIDVI